MRSSAEMIIAMTESDALALAMLTMIMVSFGVILTLLACMFRSSSRRDQQVDRLIEELENERKKVETTRKTQPERRLDAWEREEDWWIKD